MHSTKIVTSFVTSNDKLLLLRRSRRVRTMKGLWAGVSGIIENDESPLERARIEIFEEAGMTHTEIKLLRSGDPIRVESPQYRNHEWTVFPFLFETSNTRVRLNWENSEFRWINTDEMSNYNTVPSLKKVLSGLLA